MKTFRHIILALTALILASCAVEEFWDGSDYTEGEEVVMTFRPKFEDFETVTKAIGDGKQVDMLLVEVYESNTDTPIYSKEFPRKNGWDNISLPFFYGKTYQVYFWAYAKEQNAYTIEDNLKGGVTVNYPASTESLGYAALEYLDAYYAVETVNLSDDIAEDTSISLTRPFAQVNLVADITDLETAKATKVEFTINVATSFIPGGTATTAAKTFTFTSSDFFKSNEPIANTNNVYLGTTYLFVPSGEDLYATVTLYDENDNVLKEASEVKIPLESNNRTNLVFSGIEPAGPSWDDNEVKVPGAGADEWIHITRPEQLAAFLLNSTADGAKVCIDNDIDMSEIPEEVATNLAKASKSVKSLELNGNNKTVSGLSLSAFFNEATNLTVYDLTLSGITVTGTSHVGVLVNTLKGKSSFSNVNILNSSAATTNGAAGGMVGYIVRKSATERSESMPIGFTGCQVISTSAAGKESAGKFVGKFSGYDNGETLTFTDCSTSETSTSADNASPYVDGNKGAWLADTDFSTFDSWLGDEAYYRGVVTFGGVRFQPKWDGEKTIEPLLANATYDAGTTAGTNRYVVYSAFDLAGLRKKTASPTALYLMTNVDMFGQGEDGKYNVPANWTQSAIASDDDKYFQSFSTITYLDGGKNGIYNLAINTQKVSTSLYYGGFIQSTSGTTTHKDINFNDCCVVVPLVVYKNEDKGSAGMLVSNIAGDSYTMQNVHTYDCKIFALQKIGGLAARVAATSATIKSCSVNNCYIENYECKEHEESFSGGNSLASVSTTFYSYGEVGGMFGFVENNTTIDDCHVKGTTIYAYGQDDKSASKSGLAFILVDYYLVPGRHVATFIGDVRTSDDDKDVITITNCSVDDITKCTNRWDKHNNKCTTIGRAYFLYFKDSQGTVNYNTTKLTLMNCKTKQNRDQ